MSQFHTMSPSISKTRRSTIVICLSFYRALLKSTKNDPNLFFALFIGARTRKCNAKNSTKSYASYWSNDDRTLD